MSNIFTRMSSNMLKKFRDMGGYHAEMSADGAAEDYELITPANTDLENGTCRCLLVGTAGTINLMQEDGTIRTGVPVVAGYNPLVCKQIRTGGTAANIWALR